MPQLRDITGNKLSLHFHPGQLKVWDSVKRFVVMMAGTQSGKTAFGVHWLHREIIKQGAGDYIVITATFPLLNLKLQPEFLYIFRDILQLGEFKESTRTFTVSKDGECKLFGKVQDTPTRIIFASATNPEGVESATAKAAWLDEAGQKQFRREAWEAVRRRLSIHQGRALFTTTLYGLGWLKTEVYDKAKAGDADIELVQFDSTLNPAFPVVEYEKAKASMPAWKFDMFYRGQYSKPAGLIYDCFEESQSVKRFTIPDTWSRYVGHDFGPVHTAGLWAAQDPGTGYLYFYREYLTRSKTSAQDNVQAWKRISGDEPIRKRIGGSGGSQAADEGWRQAYTLSGWQISQPIIESVEVGIDRVYSWVKQKRLFIFNDLLDTLDELQSYSRELDDNYNPTEKIENKEQYHLMDSLRALLVDFQPVQPVKQDSGVMHVHVFR